MALAKLKPMPDDCLIMSWDLFVFFVVAKVACKNASVTSLDERAIVELTSCSSPKAGFATEDYWAFGGWCGTFDCRRWEWTDLFLSFDFVARWVALCVMPTDGYLCV